MEKDYIELVLKEAATKYSESPATTNCGRWLRFVAKIIPAEVIIKLFAHKLTR